MIVLECNTDEAIVKNLGFHRKDICHEKCKGEVIKRVNKISGAIGMIDEDPGNEPPKRWETFQKVATFGNIGLFSLKSDETKKVIQISPYLEHWLLDRAQKNKIDPQKYDLPDEPKKLHKISHVEKKPKFNQFIEALISKDKEIQRLKHWLLKSQLD